MANEPFGSSGQFTAQIDDTPDPSLPLVILLHGMGGDARDMTSPLTSNWAGFAFNRAATVSPYTDRGFNVTPPFLPVNGFFIDPPPLTLTSWRDALNAAGFSTATYSQVGPLIANDVAQLTALATGPLTTISKYAGLRIAFVAHSRGGILARAFLVSARTNPALAAFLPRITSCITLHTPHGGSGLVNAALGIDALVARVQAAFGALGVPSPGPLATLRSFLVNPARTELAVGSATLAGITGEPVPGVAYHTFGGTSTAFARVWANVFTPDSALPLPLPFPLFHHGTIPVVLGVPLDVRTLIPPAVLAPLPVVTELVTSAALLAASVPEIGPATGDILVAAARAHLPFSMTSINNQLNHAEALYDPTLQAQVIAILAGLRRPATPIRIIGIDFNPAGRDVDAEYVVLHNDTTAAIDLTKWTLSDVANHIYVFPPISLKGGADLKIWTKVGSNDSANLFWGRQAAIWNNTGDTAILRNHLGTEIARYTYGA